MLSVGRCCISVELDWPLITPYHPVFYILHRLSYLRNFKFGTLNDHSLWVTSRPSEGRGQRHVTLKFWGVPVLSFFGNRCSYAFKRIKLGQCQSKHDKLPPEGTWSLSHDPFLIWAPALSSEWIKLGTSNSVCRLTVASSRVGMTNYPSGVFTVTRHV